MKLIADIGGTNTRLAYLRHDGKIVGRAQYPTGQFSGPAEAIRLFLGEHPCPDGLSAAFLAVAGPVLGDRVKLTNADWSSFSQCEIQKELGLSLLRVVNDNVAGAMALPDLKAFEKINNVKPICPEVMANVGCGTGLGAAAIVPGIKDSWSPVAAELGHTSFAARDKDEEKLIACLRKGYGITGAVTFEQVASGSALPYLHAAASEICDTPHNGKQLDAAQIVKAASKGETAALDAIKFFTEGLAAFAQTAALAYLPHGGLYLTSEVVKKMGPLFDYEVFSKKFIEHPNMRHVLEPIPLRRTTQELVFDGLQRLARQVQEAAL